MKIKTTINIATYSCDVVIIVTNSLKADASKIYKKYKIVEEEDEGESEGMLLSPDIDKYFLLIDFQYLTHNTIAHEIYHAVVRVTEDRGIVDEETQAWLCGHITEVVYKFLDKKKIQIKHGR